MQYMSHKVLPLEQILFMHLENLSILNFKNYEEANIELSSQVNCFLGNNGEGKTNILDAIHYLSFCKSYFNSVDSQNVRFEQDFFVVQGEFLKEDNIDKIYCGVKKGKKKVFKRNKKDYTRLADHIGLYPLVMITPNDISLIIDGSETRRKFIDAIISQFNREYLTKLIKYNKVVEQRNALLKQFARERRFNLETLEIWDYQLIELGNSIFEERLAFLNDFSELFQDHYEAISGGKEKVGLSYKSQAFDGKLEYNLKNNLDKDKAVQYTSVGIHKDDIVFTIHDNPLKKFGSQGQQKSFLIALKLAQFHYLEKVKEHKPLLLLDDIFDKLDKGRVKHLMEMVANKDFGQVFITDTSLDRVPALFSDIDAELKCFHIEKGGVNEAK